ncbi:Molybdenum-pterin-binding protein MopA [Marinomonas aquimarina]|uniref:Molybdenum-pterin-binding protein MopA n=1 Tax=Marinomonas aquimarina TaxID=295068 RepID=A0A1A8TDL6_9GAMM|nr:TOBE domain-containing protein [Marinomonas aquimarina]SBS30440.1 Molybdenum-pterin-binding protein MopA [Marinomonas aquimarina]
MVDSNAQSAPSTAGQLTGNLFLQTGSSSAFAAQQIDLLRAVKLTGSISKAAKEVGISYKTAWDRIDAMNNLSAEPLVLRASGGAKGGGTQLTHLGERIIDGFQALMNEHAQFLARLGEQLHSLEDIANFVRSEQAMTSVRNQFRGQVVSLEHGAVNTEVVIDIGSVQPLVAIISRDSAEQLGLRAGKQAIAMVSESSILLSKETTLATSARNRLIGSVVRITEGAVNSDITIDLGQNKTLNAVITNTSLHELALQSNDQVAAIFKAPSVILMKAD